MGKAMWGALMGLGQGISQYGDTLTKDTLARQAAQREFDRQVSLEEIRQKYAETQLAETRLYNEGQKDKDREYADTKALEALTPGNPLHDAAETKRQVIRGETEDDALARIEAQSDATAARWEARGGGKASAAIQNVEYYKGLDDSGKAVFERVNKISEQGELTEKDIAKASIDLYNNFMAKDRLEKKDALKSMRLDPELTGDDLQAALIAKFQGAIRAIAAPPEAPQTFTPPATPVAPVGAPLTGMGAPGSSQKNPLDVTPQSPPPPSGTWIRSLDGRVMQVP